MCRIYLLRSRVRSAEIRVLCCIMLFPKHPDSWEQQCFLRTVEPPVPSSWFSVLPSNKTKNMLLKKLLCAWACWTRGVCVSVFSAWKRTKEMSLLGHEITSGFLQALRRKNQLNHLDRSGIPRMGLQSASSPEWLWLRSSTSYQWTPRKPNMFWNINVDVLKLLKQMFH